MTGKFDFHAWKMSLDLILEDLDVMDYVQGKIQEPPSTATAAAKTKYKKGDIRAKLMIEHTSRSTEDKLEIYKCVGALRWSTGCFNQQSLNMVS